MFTPPLSHLLSVVEEATEAVFFTRAGIILGFLERLPASDPQTSVDSTSNSSPLIRSLNPVEARARFTIFPLVIHQLEETKEVVGNIQTIWIEQRGEAWAIRPLNKEYGLALKLSEEANLARASFWLRQISTQFLLTL